MCSSAEYSLSIVVEYGYRDFELQRLETSCRRLRSVHVPLCLLCRQPAQLEGMSDGFSSKTTEMMILMSDNDFDIERYRFCFNNIFDSIER